MKFLGRNEHLSVEDQKRIVTGVSQRCHTASSVFVWGEDARIAAALLSIVTRKDLDASAFESWFKELAAEYKTLLDMPSLNTAAYVSARTQANVLAHLAAKIAIQKENNVPERIRNALSATLTQVD